MTSKPSMQNIPVHTEEVQQIKDAFVTELSPLVDVDYAAIEERIMTHYRYVRYTGKRRTVPVVAAAVGMATEGVLVTGATALMRGDGRIQLDGPKDYWCAPPDMRNPLCYGWHDCGTEWEEVRDA